jgi:hypothetical protein
MSIVVILTPPPPVVKAVNTALSQLPNAMDTPDARVMIYAIGLQESLFKHRRQVINKGGKLVPEGPAKGYWQFERGGGCRGVLERWSTRDLARTLCVAHGVHATPQALWDALEHNDVLAASIARLLLWTDPKPLPKRNEAGAEEAGWAYYLRTWRPGAWTRGNAQQRADLRAKWHRHWESAIKVVQS